MAHQITSGWSPSLLILLSLSALSVFAQEPATGVASVRARVTDSTGFVVVNASMTLTNQETGAKLSTVTDEAGNYVFPEVLAGSFVIGAEAAGFQRGVRKGTRESGSETVAVDLALEPLRPGAGPR